MRLSVVVTIVDGGTALSRCLHALFSQEHPPPLEVIVPCDDSVPGIPAAAQGFAATFLNLGTIETRGPKTGPAGQHELFDRRRAAGLAAATGDVVAIVEDRGAPRPGWAAAVVRLHQQLPHAVIGGAVENGRDRLLNWAVYFCDFGRYQLPLAAGPRAYVTDVNVSYKRRALDLTAPLWRSRYHEPVVHGALVGRGETLFLSPDLVVDQVRDNLSLSNLISERIAWGHLFASLRLRETGLVRRVVLAATSPLLPVLLFFRLARDRALKRKSVLHFAAASPVVFLLLCAWSAGEAVAYVTGRSQRS
jgi:hypothetical protein